MRHSPLRKAFTRAGLGATLALVVCMAGAQSLQEDDRIRLAEAFRMSEQLGDSLWPGWNQAPFAVLLVTPDYEYLVRHDKPTAEFERIGYDELLKSAVYRRPRQFPPNLQATFPAVNDVPTVVIGQPANTDSKDSTAWVAIVMHEHFHQLQTSQPGYFKGVAGLDLAKGDRTGMWMLNFPFPYQAPPVGKAFQDLSKAVRDPGTSAAGYAKLRQQLAQAITPDEARYAGFQLWQEGLARYTEIRIAEWAAANYVPSAAFKSLPDYRPFGEHVRALHQRVESQLTNGSIGANKRVFFYAVGAAEGMLLDRTVPGWKDRYFSQPFDTLPYFVR